MIESRSFPPRQSIAVKRALLSVFDKSGLEPFARGLAEAGIELLSTGGTARALREMGLAVTDVSEVTGFPEIMDGRVKTLHPAIHGGLLAIRDAEDHTRAMEEHGIGGIDLLVVNLYPFEETVAGGADAATIIENIDIGGPAMLRAAAKNHAYVGTVTSPEDYEAVLGEIKSGGLSLGTRRRLAQATFARTAAYDTAISNWMAGENGIETPPARTFGGTLMATMRYGENPHQGAALYTDGQAVPGVAHGEQVQGKPLSFNNINDTDAAFQTVASFSARTPTIAIIKHANPCGVAQGGSFLEAHAKALACDPVSAFGGIVALNGLLDADTAKAIIEVFTEVVIATGASDEAKAVMAGKKNIRLILTGGLPGPEQGGMDVRSVAGGLLVQGRDTKLAARTDMTCVTDKAPSETEWSDLIFAYTVAKHVKSNAIVYARDGATVGVGAGQMSRVDSSRIAARKAADAFGDDFLKENGCVVASDAFFPFADGLLAAADAGASAIIQPGGSMRDDDVIKAANDAGLAMVLTGTRHFRH
jgi:phosphoribosylaminoimidazolecarboxamide formyltransferase/IMP cyclohydrolase